MHARRLATALLSAGLMIAGGLVTATPATADPCGYFATGSDSFYNHCTNDGSRVIIEVEVFGPNYEKCVAPGKTWLGSRSKVSNAHYVGRTC
ncbi:DUF6355 family natural product biosynthesis protein [Streptomyces sp. NPDC060020]|uniref:DUF6355 family natural product biosynthesis protein n=1 Tax=unclassified Streptomyces TaxID=2593676 RepID=UPI0004C76E8B|nr:DUF6355 family natural product biosynthesis protein [Streptomyces sp. NRRL F-2580]